MDLTSIKPELLFLLPVLYVIAEIIKRTPLKNWLIPFILWGISVAMVVIYLFTEEISLENLLSGVIQGTIIAMTTIGGNQLFRQATDKRVEDNVEAKLNEQTSEGK
jgi:hypothetical protein